MDETPNTDPRGLGQLSSEDLADAFVPRIWPGFPVEVAREYFLEMSREAQLDAVDRLGMIEPAVAYLTREDR